MTKTYLMMYCTYNPTGAYYGHRIKEIQAASMEEAETKGHQWLEGMAGKGNWEYIIAEKQTHYRIYDNKEHKRQ